MKNEGSKRTEEYTENKAACYRLPNITTMENLSMQVTAGEGAVLKMDDKVWSPTLPGRALSPEFTSSLKRLKKPVSAILSVG